MRATVLIVLAAATAVGLALAGPIPQDPAYHDFADQRGILGVPNFMDVVSNAAFTVVGVLGLWFLFRKRPYADPRERAPWAVFFFGVGMVGFGSGYYHLSPDDARLFWDRLPMAVAFMALFSAVVAERMSLRAGLRSLPFLVIAGAGSLVYWRATGDLRLYAFTQYFPMGAIPLILLMYPGRYTKTGGYFVALGGYGLSKVAEFLDEGIFEAGRVISGHTIKHLLAAAATWWILRMIQRREPVA